MGATNGHASSTANEPSVSPSAKRPRSQQAWPRSTQYMQVVLGRKATPEWNMPLLAVEKTSVSRPTLSPNFAAAAWQNASSHVAQVTARPWRTAKKTSGFSSEPATSRASTACSSMYVHERRAYCGAYSQVCWPLPYSK